MSWGFEALIAIYRCIQNNTTACNRFNIHWAEPELCVVEGTDIVVNFNRGRGIFSYAMRDVINAAEGEVGSQLRVGGDRVLRDSELPWTIFREGLRIRATTPGREPRLLTWEVLYTSLRGLYQCGYSERKYQELLTSIWDVRGNFYGDLSLLNRPPRAIQ